MTAFLDKDLNCLTLYLQGQSPNFFLKNSRQFKGVTSMIEVIIDRQISSPILLIVIIFSSDCGLLTGLELTEWFCCGKTVQKGYLEY